MSLGHLAWPFSLGAEVGLFLAWPHEPCSQHSRLPSREAGLRGDALPWIVVVVVVVMAVVVAERRPWAMAMPPP